MLAPRSAAGIGGRATEWGDRCEGGLPSRRSRGGAPKRRVTVPIRYTRNRRMGRYRGSQASTQSTCERGQRSPEQIHFTERHSVKQAISVHDEKPPSRCARFVTQLAEPRTVSLANRNLKRYEKMREGNIVANQTMMTAWKRSAGESCRLQWRMLESSGGSRSW